MLNETFTSLFGAEEGLLIADLRGDIDDSSSGWNGEPFSEREKEKFRDIIDLLGRQNAIISYKTKDSLKANDSELRYDLI